MNAIDLASYSFNSAAAPGEVELLTALEERPLFLSDEVASDEVVLGVRYEYNTYFCDIYIGKGCVKYLVHHCCKTQSDFRRAQNH